jgi:replicative DNA helicase
VTIDIAKPMPADLNAERALLGAAILYPDSALELLSLARETDFSTRENCLVFRRIQSLLARGSAVDLVTLIADLNQSGELEGVGGAGYISGVLDGIPYISNVKHYAQIVRDRAKLRELIQFGAKLQDRAWGGSLETDSLISYAVDSTLQIATGADAPVTSRPFSEVAENAMREIERAQTDPGSIRLFRFGLSDLDDMTGGLRPKELVVIVAPTSNGKTLLASQCAMQADRDGFKVLYFSAEMPAEQLVQREIAWQASVKFYYVRRPDKLYPEELERLRVASKRKCDVQFVDRDITPTRVWAMSEAAKKTRGLDLVFIDYDQLVIEAGINPEGDEDNVFRHQRAFILNAKKLTERLDVCVVVLAQLRKISTKVLSGAHPHLDDIWGDSSIRNTPHVILWLSREFFTHNMDAAFERKANVYVLKSRNDRTGIVPLEFDPERVRFTDAPPTDKDSIQESRRTSRGI